MVLVLLFISFSNYFLLLDIIIQAPNPSLLSSQVDELRNEFRLRMREQDGAKEQAVAEAERRTETIFEDRMRDFVSLQVVAFKEDQILFLELLL